MRNQTKTIPNLQSFQLIEYFISNYIAEVTVAKLPQFVL